MGKNSKILSQLRLNRGQKGAALVTLLFFVIIGITIISAEAIVLYTNILSASNTEQGLSAYYAAESGIEEGLIRLIRNPGYNGSTIAVGSGNVVIQVSSSTIIATGRYGNTTKKIQAETTRNNGVLTITSWKEID